MTIYLTPPRGRDGRYAPRPEVGIARHLTALLRAALGYDVLPDTEPDRNAELIAAQEKTLGRIARRVVGGIGGIRWDPLLHPRDASGRFIEAGDRVTVDRGPGRLTVGRVTGNTPDGTVHVTLPDGSTDEVDPGTVHVTGATGAARTIAPIPIRGRPEGRGTIDDPIDVGDDVALAATLVAAGKHIRLTQHEQAATLVDLLATMVREATKRGDDSTYDLSLVTVEGSNLFTHGSLGKTRIKMPQFTGVPLPDSPASTKPVAFTGDDGRERVDITGDFIATLRARGIGVTDTTMPASHIRATQRDLSVTTVAGVMDRIRGGRYVDAPLLVTRDGYLLDGHHRWAAMVALAADPDAPIPVTVIDLDVGATLDMARAFTAAMGMPVRGVPVRRTVPDDHTPTPYDQVITQQWRRSLTGDERDAVAALTEVSAADLTSTVTATSANDVLGNVVTARGTVTTPTGEEAGFFKTQTRVDDYGVTLNIDSVIVYPQHRAHGFGTAWIKNVVAAAQEQGIDRITLNANVDVGGYVWAARGWEWDPDQWDRNAEAWRLIALRLRTQARRVTDPGLRRQVTATARHLDRAAADPTVTPPSPRTVAMLGHQSASPDSNGVPMWPGKVAMLGSSWWGTLDLADVDAESPVAAFAAMPDVVVTEGEQVTVGRAEGGGPRTGTVVTVGGTTYARFPAGLRRQCGRCSPEWSGSVTWSGLDYQVCWECRGAGVVGPVLTEAEAVKREKRRVADAARRAAKAKGKADKAAADAAAWADAHPDLAAGLADVRAASEDDDGPPIPGFLVSMAFRAAHGPLTDRQAAAAESALAEWRRDVADWQAERAVKDATRWVGDVGGTVTVTGTVDAVIPVEGRYGTSLLVVVRGTGDDDGVIVKTFTTAKWARQVRRGDTVTVTGEVRAHDTRDGERQTQIVRPKVAAGEPGAKALGGIGHVAADIVWDPLLHPRDDEGQFTVTLDRLLPPAPTPPDAGQSHRPPPRDEEEEPGQTLDDVSMVMPGFYEHPEYYPANGPEIDRESIQAIMSARGNPDAIVTVYRAVSSDDPQTSLRANDWVTPSRAYADLHGQGPLNGDYRVIEQRVRAGDLFSEGNSVNEFGWNPTVAPEPAADLVRPLRATADKPRKAPPPPKSATMTPDELRAYRTDRDTGRMRPDPATLTPPPGWHDVTTDEEREQIKQRLGRPLPPGFVRIWALDDWSGPEKIKVNGFADNWKKQPIQGKASRSDSLDRKFTRFRKVVAKRMPRLTRAARREAASDGVALAVALMIVTGARVGTTKGSAKEEHVGITSLRREHVTIVGDTVTLHFTAKGHENTYEFTDPAIAKALDRRLTGLQSGDEVFPDVTDDRTMRYIRKAMGPGAETVVNHDMRTAAANSLAAKVMAQLIERDGPPTTKAEAKRLKKAVAAAVAERLNDTVTVVVNNYIDPRVWSTLGWEV